MLLELRLTAPQTLLNQTKTQCSVEKSKLNYYKADFKSINQELSTINWNTLLEEQSVSKQYDTFQSTVENVCKKYTPESKPKLTSFRSKFYKERRALMRKRRRIVTAINKCNTMIPTEKLQNKLNDTETKIKESHTAERTANEMDAIKKISSNPKYFYGYARKTQNKKETIGPFRDKSTSEIISDDKQIADRLQTQFCSVFTTSDPSTKISDIKSFFNEPHTPTKLSDIQFTTSDIQKAIKELKSNSAPGLDGFPAMLLKECSETLSEPLYIIFRHSIDFGEVPNILKDAIIIPIHKGDLKSVPKNYRPINLISHVLKVLEKIIRSRLVEYLEESNQMNPNQHGFRKFRSCLSQLLEHFDQIIEAAYNNKNSDVIYLDFCKAFDVVDHSILIRKLKTFGITGKIGYWLHSFLSNRKQTVSVNGVKSETSPVTSGVPQGSVLGPVLFLIMISDIDKDILVSVANVFADDTKLKNLVESLQDCANLQTDLNTVYEWADTNNMKFNDLKFQCIKYGNNLELNQYKYETPSGEEIPGEEDIKDLGVIMSRNFTFTKHIDKVSSRCRGLIGWILRTFITRTKLVMLTLFKALVLPRIDYCSQLYSPTLIKEWIKLESVQRRFTSHIAEVKEFDYWSRLKQLKLYSIQRRYERYTLIYVWKIIQKLAPNLKSNPITTRYSERRGLSCVTPALANTRCSAKIVTIREGSFAIRGPRLFNALPKHLRNLSDISADSFKRALDKVLSTLPDQPTVPGYAGGRSTNSNSLVDILPAWSHDANMYSGGGHTCRP